LPIRCQIIFWLINLIDIHQYKEIATAMYISNKVYTLHQFTLEQTKIFPLICNPYRQLYVFISYKYNFFFYVQCVKVSGDCSFYRYWWNCWPSLFKLSFHYNYIYVMAIVRKFRLPPPPFENWISNDNTYTLYIHK
jgi:hypothetical protein